MTDAARQAASFIARKNRRSRQFISALPPWTPHMSVTAGMLVQSFDAAWQAGSTGTAGTVAPAIGDNDVAYDGSIEWTRQWRLLTGG